MNPIKEYPSWLADLMNRLFQTLGWSISDQSMNILLLVIWGILIFTLIATVAQASVIFMVLMERKVLAWLTQRKGPNRVGPWGLLQTLADGVKLLFKEDIIATGADPFLFTLGPAIFFLPTFIFFALIPFTNQLMAVIIPAGALLVFALSSISVVGIVLAGWASNNKYSLLGGIRSAAQAISYEIPLVMAVLAVVLFTGTMDIGKIVQAQQGPFWNWYGVLLTPVSLVIFGISALAEVNRVPFDLPEAESELVSGYNTEYTGMKFALFFLAEYAALFAMCAFTTAFFLGGYLSPFGTFFTEWATGHSVSQMSGFSQMIVQIEMLFWFMSKTYIMIFIAMWIRGTLPRLKPDQLMGFSWKFLIPLSLLNVMLVAFEKYWVVLVPQFQGLAVATAPFLQAASWVNWLIWLVFAAAFFGLFFFVMSRLLNQKLTARLAGR